MKILIDNGHGKETPGKRSPDSKLMEYEFCRKVAHNLEIKLLSAGYDAELITPEINDVPLATRCRRINAWCAKLGTSNVISISIHVNAAGADGKWHNAKGWQVCVSLNASSGSKSLADCLLTAASEEGLKTRVPSPGIAYWKQNLAICRDTWCPAVLTENMFMDNEDDCQWLLTDEGLNKIVDLHYNGIIKYIKTHK